MPPETGHAYIGAELRVAAALRAELLSQGMTDGNVSSKSYWRRGRANAPHGEPAKD